MLKLPGFCATSHPMTFFRICPQWLLFCKEIVTDGPLICIGRPTPVTFVCEWHSGGGGGNVTRNQFDMYSFVSQSWCAFWQKNDMLFKWSIVKSTSEPKPLLRLYSFVMVCYSLLQILLVLMVKGMDKSMIALQTVTNRRKTNNWNKVYYPAPNSTRNKL